MKRFWFVAIAIAVLAGLGFAALVGIAALDHNPQGEFHDWDTGAIHWDAFGPLLSMAFLIPLFAVSLAAGIIRLLSRRK